MGRVKVSFDGSLHEFAQLKCYWGPSMQNNSREQELSRDREEVAEIIIRGYEHEIGKPTIVAQVMDLGYSREVAMQLVDSFESVLFSSRSS